MVGKLFCNGQCFEERPFRPGYPIMDFGNSAIYGETNKPGKVIEEFVYFIRNGLSVGKNIERNILLIEIVDNIPSDGFGERIAAGKGRPCKYLTHRVRR